MEQTSEVRALWKLALPLALAQAGQALMGLVDTAVLGRLSAAAQAGAGLGNSLTFTCSFFGMGVMFALDPLVSQAVGAGEMTKARTHYWQGVWLAVLTSVVVALPIAVLPFFLESFGIEPDIAGPARIFMWWRIPGVLGGLLFVAARSYLTGLGRVQVAFWAMLLANVANLLLDVVLVFGAGPIPSLGVMGAAISTDTCMWLQFVVMLFAFGPSLPGVKRSFDGPAVWKAIKLGAPIGLHFIAESGVFSLVGLFATRFGAVPGAAHQVALNWGSVTFCVTAGIGSAAATRVGWSIGRGDAPGARRAGFTAFGSAVLFMVFASLLFIVFPEPLARLMTSDSDVVALTVALFFVLAVFQLSDGLQAVGAGALRGIGDTTFTFWANMVGHWCVGLPIAWFFGVNGTYGVVGLWWGLSAGLTFVALALVVRFERRTRGSISRI